MNVMTSRHHSIISSAAHQQPAGNPETRVLSVLRLITRSNLTERPTGRSAQATTTFATRSGHRWSSRAAVSNRGHVGGYDARIYMGRDETALIRLWQEKRGEAAPPDLPASSWCSSGSPPTGSTVRAQFHVEPLRWPADFGRKLTQFRCRQLQHTHDREGAPRSS